MPKITNLLHETKKAIATSGHTETDIVFIGSEETGHQCTWPEFCVLADVEYNAGYGTAEVAQDLIIVFSDGAQMWRDEDAGREWWAFATPFKHPPESKPIRSLFGPRLGDDNLPDVRKS